MAGPTSYEDKPEWPIVASLLLLKTPACSPEPANLAASAVVQSGHRLVSESVPPWWLITCCACHLRSVVDG
ncbi:MAG: hypothetical protein EA418_03165 [Wenzhouxiangellaceae bacterium]|nr:MAG: hypothetical protein EA418_03165 [Wenzhouxiangellaceae bacterium]